MLWADTHELTNIIHFFEDIAIVYCSSALALRDETSEHRDGCRLSSTIVAKQGKNLPVVHLDVEVLHGLEPSRIGLL